MLTIILGIATSIAAELVTWLNKKLDGTVLKGDAAFFIAAVVAFIAAAVKLFLVPNVSFQDFLTGFAQIWAVSQGFFLIVIQLFGLDVKEGQ